MNASVIICTHNRSQLLADALVAFRGQTASPGEYELIVVDNASSDKTEDVVRHASKDLKNLHYFHEPELGLSHARNRGIKEAKGDIIIFIDDDALPESDWIEVLIRSFQSVFPIPVCVGGRILPKWEVPIPAWFPDGAHIQSLSLVDIGDDPRWLFTPSLGAGNLAIRKSAFRRIGGFDTRLGRKGTSPFSMEEILFLFLVLQEYGRQSLMYQPAAVVHHRITENRMVDLRHVLRRSYGDGISKAVMKDIISRMDFRGKYGSSWVQTAKYGKIGGMAESAFRLVQGSLMAFQAAAGMDRRKLTECLIKLAFGTGEMLEMVKSFLFFREKRSWDV